MTERNAFELATAQIDFWWDVHFRPRVEGLSDDEYMWEPAAGCWTVRVQDDGRLAPDGGFPEPYPSPFTTDRLAHVPHVSDRPRAPPLR
jgi:hypothetical protein